MKKPRAEVTKGKWLFVDTRNGIAEEFEHDKECIEYAIARLNDGDSSIEDVRVLRVIEEYEPVSTGYTFKKI